MNSLEDLGYNNSIEKFRTDNNLNIFEIGRVIAEHKERYIIKTEKGEFEVHTSTKGKNHEGTIYFDLIKYGNKDSNKELIHDKK